MAIRNPSKTMNTMDVVCVFTMMKCFIDGGKYRNALDLYDTGNICIHLGEYEKGKCFHRKMKNISDRQLHLKNILINLYDDCGATEIAKDILNEIKLKKEIFQLSDESIYQ